ncbi:MAG: tagaturonate reductase [Spirochaetales bacterium]|nr:tagaturonate reductase [Spirochaetales bacterium]
MKKLNRKDFTFPERPVRVLQFGEGNFLRCFIDWQLDILNEKRGLDAGVVVVRPIDTDFPPSLNTQDGLYTSILRGFDEEGQFQDQRRLISAVNREISVYSEYEEFLSLASLPDLRFIVSNTTEAGIAFDEADRFEMAPPGTYPAKLTRFLFERYRLTKGDPDKGFILLPCELIDYNGEKLKEIVLKYASLWKLEEGFIIWLEEGNTFCSTLVDRIVTGHPGTDARGLIEELGYEDDFIATGEFFHLFVIQAPEAVAKELKLPCPGLNIRIVEDLKPYKVRKVGILNGCHTAMVPVAYLAGQDLVKDSVEDPRIGKFISRLIDEEIIPCLGLPEDYVKEFADSVIGRFRNPYVKHQLLSISLNSMTKFKTRLLPQFLNYQKTRGAVPPLISFALASLICFYRGERTKDGRVETYELKDDLCFLELYRELWQETPGDAAAAEKLVTSVLGQEDHWGTDLTKLDGFVSLTTGYVLDILQKGMEETLDGIFKC